MDMKPLIQEIQDAFAKNVDLTMVVTDDNGVPSTHFSHITPLSEYVFHLIFSKRNESLHEQMKMIREMAAPMLLDVKAFSEIHGLKMIVAPFHTRHKETTYILWSGFLIEKGYKKLVISHFPKDSPYKNEFKELNYLEIDTKLQTIQKMSKIFSDLFSLGNDQQKFLSFMEQMASFRFTGLAVNEIIKKSLSILTGFEPQLDFLVYAKQEIHLPGQFRVVYTWGPFKRYFEPLSFSVKDTKLQDAVKENRFIQFDPRNEETNMPFLPNKFIPKTLFCLPVENGSEICGLIIGGSIKTSILHHLFYLFLKLTGQLISNYLHLENLQKRGHAGSQFSVVREEAKSVEHLFKNGAPSPIHSLTAREQEVLKYLTQGLNNQEIADELLISVHTVKNHITNIYQKLGVSDRTHLITMLYQNGVL